MPVYILLPQFGTKYFRGEEIATQFERGSSAVFVHRLKGVRGGFHMRDIKDLTETDVKARDDLNNVYNNQIFSPTDLTTAKTN